MRYSVLLITACITFFSCTRDADSPNSVFYGKWETSYGDTIQFYRTGNQDLLSYNYTMNPDLPMVTTIPFNYEQQKLWILEHNTVWKTLDSFAWVEEGKSFTILGIQWFMFMASTQTVFTFTRIR